MTGIDISPLNVQSTQQQGYWRVEENGETFEDDETPKYIIDTRTGLRYQNDTIETIRANCILLSLATPVVHIPGGIINIAYRIIRMVSGHHFPRCSKNKNPEKCLGVGKDGLRIIAQPFSIAGLWLSAFYGICNPLEGRKFYASIEKAQYGRPILAPCFQPEPKRHFFGEDINVRQ